MCASYTQASLDRKHGKRKRCTQSTTRQKTVLYAQHAASHHCTPAVKLNLQGRTAMVGTGTHMHGLKLLVACPGVCPRGLPRLIAE
jgi:hypothetical protein